MHIHFLQHFSHEGPGSISDWATGRKFSTSVTLLDSCEILPNMESFDWLIVLGGPMSVHDEHLYPWLVAEKNLIRQAMQEKKVVIGICLGAQLIAHVAGAGVGPNTQPEIGFYPVDFNENAKNDPVFRYFPKHLTTFHWHGDIFGLPENAVNMASSEITPCQAFRLGETIFGFQFHPECTIKSITSMIEYGKEELDPASYIQSEPEIRRLMNHIILNNTILHEVLDKITSMSPGILT
jgi:GMP synthase-like glutamine amidotransferase